MSVVFDKLPFVRRLEADGQFPRGQAEAMSEAFHQAVVEAVATKSDVAEAKALFKSDLAETRAELKAEISATRHEIVMLRNELKLWMGSLAAALFAALSGVAAAMRFLGH